MQSEESWCIILYCSNIFFSYLASLTTCYCIIKQSLFLINIGDTWIKCNMKRHLFWFISLFKNIAYEFDQVAIRGYFEKKTYRIIIEGLCAEYFLMFSYCGEKRTRKIKVSSFFFLINFDKILYVSLSSLRYIPSMERDSFLKKQHKPSCHAYTCFNIMS